MEKDEQITYTFRFPKALKERLQVDAEKHSRSVNRHVVHVLTAYLDAQEPPKPARAAKPKRR